MTAVGIPVILAAIVSAETTASSVGVWRQWQCSRSMDGRRVLSVMGGCEKRDVEEREGFMSHKWGIIWRGLTSRLMIMFL